MGSLVIQILIMTSFTFELSLLLDLISDNHNLNFDKSCRKSV